MLGLISLVYAMMQPWMRDHRFDVAFGSLMGKIGPNWFVGISTPWTLSSKLSWSRMHRAGG